MDVYPSLAADVPIPAQLLDLWRALDRLAAHEAFHVHQWVHHPEWAANEADLFVYPFEDVTNLGRRRLETAALRRALE